MLGGCQESISRNINDYRIESQNLDNLGSVYLQKRISFEHRPSIEIIGRYFDSSKKNGSESRFGRVDIYYNSSEKWCSRDYCEPNDMIHLIHCATAYQKECDEVLEHPFDLTGRGNTYKHSLSGNQLETVTSLLEQAVAQQEQK